MVSPADFRAKRECKSRFSARMRVVKILKRWFAIELFDYRIEEVDDPLVKFCSEEIPRTQYGKVGLYCRPDILSFAFHKTFLKPIKYTRPLEEVFQEARDVYPKNELVGAVFWIGNDAFVYTDFEGSERDTVLSVRRRRFIYTLEGFLGAVSAIPRDEEEAQ